MGRKPKEVVKRSNDLKGSHYGYCHFTYKNRVNSWRCICDVIRGYLAWVELHEKERQNIKYNGNASAQA